MMARWTCSRSTPSYLLAMIAMSVTGCYNFRQGYTYFPPGAMNQPVGTFTRQWQAAQAEKVYQHGLVLWEASWIDGTDRLGPAAESRLRELCQPNCAIGSMITLQASPDRELDQRRTQAVMDFVHARGTTIDPNMIVVADPDSNVLYGEEAVRVSREMMQGNRRGASTIALPYGAGSMFGFDSASGLSSTWGAGQ